MQVINLTPHAITVVSNGETTTFPPSGTVARVSTITEPAGEVIKIPVAKSRPGEIMGLPAPQEGVVLLVSGMVAQAAARPDVVSPDTGASAIRKDGQVVAVRGFLTF